ncbi:TetR/AcrR family transcriptional regulator [Cupriavidus lacunae]|uniref:TetR/AcrR family transcriptional regulator n=1 Tax=Cupriavidus lacunae TaxID=2666307 RepID=UPI001FC9BD11|nr:TetR/AcrR family transcriptional regulator [Cupriavidus lacunae]
MAELMKHAGFTHGGFYNHFASKEALAVKAVNFAFRQRAAEVTPGDGIDKILRRYISDEHLNQRGESCPIAGLGSDAALHQTEEVKAVFREGIEALIRTYEAALSDRATLSHESRRALAMNVLAKAVGAVVMARAVPAGDPLSHEILETCLAGALADVAPRAGG